MIDFFPFSFSRVGAPNKGVRFLTYVEAIQSLGHLLQKSDIDRAASMCRGLKGCLRSRFICLSDDVEPPPNPRQKRTAENDADVMDTDEQAPPSKR